MNNFAWYLVNRGKYAEALPYARKSVKIYPHESHFDTLGHVYLGLKRYREAESEFQKALEISSYNGSSLLGMAQIYETRKEFQKAIETYQRADAGPNFGIDIDGKIKKLKEKLHTQKKTEILSSATSRSDE